MNHIKLWGMMAICLEKGEEDLQKYARRQRGPEELRRLESKLEKIRLIAS